VIEAALDFDMLYRKTETHRQKQVKTLSPQMPSVLVIKHEFVQYTPNVLSMDWKWNVFKFTITTQ